MVTFKAVIEQFREKGEKTGWTYIEVPLNIAERLMAGNKKSFRVKGKLDAYSFEGIGLLPMGEGNFIMALNATIRKAIKKQKGATVQVKMEPDTKQKPLSKTLLDCLRQEPEVLKYFKTLPPSHQRYFSNWIESAKTDATKVKRIAQAMNGLALQLGFGEMVRATRKKVV